MTSEVSFRTYRRRRVVVIITVLFAVFAAMAYESFRTPDIPASVGQEVLADQTSNLALEELEGLAVKGRAPKTDYERSQFGSGWAEIADCDMRNVILARDLIEVKLSDESCIVLSGILNDPYTGRRIDFVRGSSTSQAVQIDHIVALSDAWQKGAQDMDELERELFANDPLNLLAVDGNANQQKGDSDAASWLPENKQYRCQYVARQIAVKRNYGLWVTEAEKAAMKRVLLGCSNQVLPIAT